MIDARDRTRRPGRVRSPRRSRDADRVARRANTHRARPPPRRTAPRSPAGRWLAYFAASSRRRARAGVVERGKKQRSAPAWRPAAPFAAVDRGRCARGSRARPAASTKDRARAVPRERTRGAVTAEGGADVSATNRAPDVSVGFLVFFFLKSFSLGSCAFQSYISCGIEKRQHGSVRKR